MIGRKHIGKQSRSVSAILSRVYAGPSDEHLRRRVPLATLYGRVELSRLDVTTSLTDEGAFIAHLNTALYSTLEDMADVLDALRSPTFPVHDPPSSHAY